MIEPQSSSTPSETQTEQFDSQGNELIMFVPSDEDTAEFIPSNDEITTFSE